MCEWIHGQLKCRRLLGIGGCHKSILSRKKSGEERGGGGGGGASLLSAPGEPK